MEQKNRCFKEGRKEGREGGGKERERKEGRKKERKKERFKPVESFMRFFWCHTDDMCWGVRSQMFQGIIVLQLLVRI